MSTCVIATAGANTTLAQGLTPSMMLLRTGMPTITASGLIDSDEEPVTACFDPTLPPYATGLERAKLLAAGALREALSPWASHGKALRWKGLCTVSVSATDVTPLRVELDGTARTLALPLEHGVVKTGSAGIASMLPKLLAEVRENAIDALVLGGVHSDHDPSRIKELEAAGRLFRPDRVDALIPGECAAFVVVTRPEIARQIGVRNLARIERVASAVGTIRPDTMDSAYKAQALTQVMREALSELGPDGRAGWGLCDHTFETFRIREWQAAMTRTHKRWEEPAVIDAPAQRIGHLGAAALPLMLALASETWRRGAGPSPRALLFAGSDTGERAAILVCEQ